MKFTRTQLACCLAICLISSITLVADAQQSPLKITIYEDDNGWEGRGSSMQLPVGSYSNRGRGDNNKTLRPNQQSAKSFGRNDEWNDEVRAVAIPEGLTVYMTDDDSFKPGKHGVITLRGPRRVNIKDVNRTGLAGKVSSIRVSLTPKTAAAPMPTHDYSVTLHTGAQDADGTTANVYVTLHGREGDSPEVLVNPLVMGVPFQPGQGSTAILKLKNSIGNVTGITVRTDYKNQDSWWLQYAAVGSKTSSGQTFDFNHAFNNMQPQTRRASIK